MKINNISDLGNIDIGIISGSGLYGLSNILSDITKINYSDISLLPQVSVAGHKDYFEIGDLNDLRVMIANGRFHYYEGLEYNKVSVLVDIFHQLQCQNIIITNSSGCLNTDWDKGDIMIVDSHIDMTFRISSKPGEKISGNEFYNQKLIDLAKQEMKKMDIPDRVGTYGWVLGPTYETVAEIDFMKSLDIMAVGMSTVPEIIKANELNIPLLTLSCLTNYAAGTDNHILSHGEVVDSATEYKEKLIKLIQGILNHL